MSPNFLDCMAWVMEQPLVDSGMMGILIAWFPPRALHEVGTGQLLIGPSYMSVLDAADWSEITVH